MYKAYESLPERLTNVPLVMNVFCTFVYQYNHWYFMYEAYAKYLGFSYLPCSCIHQIVKG
jgi:hypothetical protein